MIRIASMLASAVLVLGCTAKPQANLLLCPSELTALVSGKTVIVGSPSGKNLLVYLASGGTGWTAEGVRNDAPPRPGEMSMVIGWQIADGSRVCWRATPLIGDMPSFIGPYRKCLQLFRAPDSASGLVGVVEGEDGQHSGPVAIYPWNAFPPPAIDQYLAQVRVLYGGTIPTWNVQ